jgi:hypothetical protein
MSLLTESKHPGQFLLLEMPRDYSRKKATVLSGQNLLAGAVVGRVNYGVGRASIPAVVGTGNGLMTLVTGGPDVELGNYVITCITAVANNGVFSVVAPSGKALPNATMAGGSVAYKSSHINFTITDGSTDFAADDVFTIVVSTTAPTVIGGTGTGTISAITLGPDAKPGNYRVENIEAITNGGAFKVVGPDGEQVNVGYVVAGASGTWVVAGHRQLNFTITEATDFIVANYFDVCVFNIGERDEGKLVAWDPIPSTYDGRQNIAGVLLGKVDATAGDLPGVIVAHDAVINGADLTYGAAISAALKQAAVQEFRRRLNIVVD